jgi:hypothetical protein
MSEFIEKISKVKNISVEKVEELLREKAYKDIQEEYTEKGKSIDDVPDVALEYLISERVEKLKEKGKDMALGGIAISAISLLFGFPL